MRELTDFLLARVAEDEERANYMAAFRAGRHFSFGEDWRLTVDEDHDELCIEPSRVLAECQAKRAVIVSALVDSGSSPDAWGVHLHALERMATVYAGHPDYDPAWALEDE